METMAKLTGVTLTGADDATSVDDLRDLSATFPFVEWGVLVGSGRGTSRFPSSTWFRLLFESMCDEDRRTMRMSLHICGRVLRGMLDNSSFLSNCGTELLNTLPLFARWQLNVNGREVTKEQAEKLFLVLLAEFRGQEVIVQLGRNDWLLDFLLAKGIRASGLYDGSGGKGVLPGSWPSPNPKWEVGYAGGLGPDNVRSELDRIGVATGQHRFWIDMETKLRTLDTEEDIDYFDLRKCRDVLEECQRFFPMTKGD